MPRERVDFGGEDKEASNLSEQNCLDSLVCQKGEVETRRDSPGVHRLGTSLVLPVQVTQGAQEGGPARC